PFCKDGDKSSLPKAKTKAKPLKAKKVALKSFPSHGRKKIHISPTFKELPRRNKLDHYAITKFPVTESAMKKVEDNNTFVYTVDVKVSKHQIKQAAKKLCDIDVSKVNTLIRPEREKKAYVQLAPDYGALDLANKIGTI
uniref:Large ribosomal subunit protein uL23 n=1 Tax=Mustela putorius furo TaxID=9669 RepID=M3YB20_MUSPF